MEEITLELIQQAYSRILNVSHYHIFTLAVFLDIASGFLKAIVGKDLDSKVGVEGLAKHIAVIALVFLTSPYLWLLGYGWAGKAIIYFMVATYGISIVENYEAMGLPLPDFVGQFFRRVKESTKNMNIEDVEKTYKGDKDV